jgi:uncharacterized DUF497 family protein
VPITFDAEKNARNIVERGLSFERVAALDWRTALLVEDERRDYGEPRIRVFALFDGRLHTWQRVEQDLRTSQVVKLQIPNVVERLPQSFRRRPASSPKCCQV